MSSTGPVTMKSSNPLIPIYCTQEQTSPCTLLVKDVSEMQQIEPGYNDNDLYDTSSITSNILWFSSLVYFFTPKLYANLQL
jgi:hypothetical protein